MNKGSEPQLPMEAKTIKWQVDGELYNTHSGLNHLNPVTNLKILWKVEKTVILCFTICELFLPNNSI